MAGWFGTDLWPTPILVALRDIKQSRVLMELRIRTALLRFELILQDSCFGSPEVVKPLFDAEPFEQNCMNFNKLSPHLVSGLFGACAFLAQLFFTLGQRSSPRTALRSFMLENSNWGKFIRRPYFFCYYCILIPHRQTPLV